jgi:hypothetical protein
MRRAAFTAAAIAVAVLLVCAVGVYAYDRSRVDEIADGVSIGGVDVGGLGADEARELLEEKVAEPLKRPVRVTVEGRRYKLSAEDADVRVDVDALVDRAVERSRDGNVVARTFRDLTGGDLGLSMPAESSYSKRAVESLVERVAADVDREPQDAAVAPGPTDLGTTPAQEGRRLRADDLIEEVKLALSSPEGSNAVKGRVDTVEPEVTEDELASQYPLYITIDRSSYELRLWRNLKLEKSYDVAVGQAGYDTPTGTYNIQSKQVDPAWHVPEREWAGDLAGTVVPGGAPDNPLKARWMGIADGAGIHGTSDSGSIGSAASHGCIRMHVPEVIDLYDRVDVGTPVYIGDS